MQISYCTLSDKRGAIAIIAGFALLMVLGFAALIIDIGYGLVVRNALQNVADAASLAAARELGSIYVGMPVEAQSSYQLSPGDRQDILDKAIERVGKSHTIAGKVVQINGTDIAIGRWDTDTKTLMISDDRPDAVRVVTRRDTLGNGAINTLFAGIIGRDTIAVTAHATAALGGLSYAPPGTIDTPVGISEKLLDCPDPIPGCFCGTLIQFSDTKDSCAGWTTFEQNPNTPNLLDILDQMIANEYVSPAIQAGATELEYVGGEMTPAWEKLKTLYDQNKDASGMWKTTVVIYKEDNDDPCDNPNELTEVVGFAKITITNVLAQPDKEIQGHITCNTVVDGRGGGSNLGVFGSIPNLVQ